MEYKIIEKPHGRFFQTKEYFRLLCRIQWQESFSFAKMDEVKPDYVYSEIWIPVIKKNDRWLFEKTWMEFYREFRNR